MTISIIDIAKDLIKAIEENTDYEAEDLKYRIKDELEELKKWTSEGLLETRITN